MSDSMTRRVMMRLWITAAVLLLAVVAVVARAVNLQVMETEFLQSRGEAHYLRAVEIPTVRGTVFDRTGEPLAVSTPVESVWAHPGELLQAADHIPMLAGLLESDAADLERKLMQRAGREFVWLRRRINPDLADKIRALDVPGVFLQREYMRFYPAGEVMAQVLGFTNIDDIGQEGLELAYNESLRGRPGRKRVIKDRLGRIVQNVEMISEARPGQDLHLTIDRRLQYLAFRDLKTRVIEYGAESGTVVVLGAKTGEILAMASYPSYNPNSVTRAASDGLRNRAVTDVLEPGSVMKPFAVAAAMEAGIAQRDMVIDTSPGVISVSGHRIRDTRDFGELTVEGLLTKSSNVGVVQLALAMDARNLWSVYSRLGFGWVPAPDSRASRRACCATTSAGASWNRQRWPMATACRSRPCSWPAPWRPLPTAAACVNPPLLPMPAILRIQCWIRTWPGSWRSCLKPSPVRKAPDRAPALKATGWPARRAPRARRPRAAMAIAISAVL